MTQVKINQIEQILKEHGAELVRHKRHKVYKFPDGKVFVQSCTSVNWKGTAQNLADLRRLLGLQPEFKEGERREKKPKNGRDKSNDLKVTPAVKAKPQRVSLAEVKLQLELDELKTKHGKTLTRSLQLELDKEALERQLELALEESPSMWQKMIGKVWTR